VPESEVEKVKKAKKVTSEAAEVPAKKRKGNN
jgi:hypothetical protein